MTTAASPLDLQRAGLCRLRPFLRDFEINGENGCKPLLRRPESRGVTPALCRGTFSRRLAGYSRREGALSFRAVEHAEPVLAADLGDVGRRGDLLQRRQDLAVAAGVARHAAAAASHVEADAD